MTVGRNQYTGAHLDSIGGRRDRTHDDGAVEDVGARRIVAPHLAADRRHGAWRLLGQRDVIAHPDGVEPESLRELSGLNRSHL